jgi:hypothetical protein
MIDNLVSEAERLFNQNASATNIGRVMTDIEVEIKLQIANSSKNTTGMS